MTNAECRMTNPCRMPNDEWQACLRRWASGLSRLVIRHSSFVIGLVLLAAGPTEAAARWQRNYNEALKAAQDSGRPLVILFGPDVPAMAKAHRKMIEDDRLAPFHPLFVFVHIAMPVKDGKMSDPLFAKYPPGGGQHMLPIIVFADEAEKTLHKTEGPQSAESIALAMRVALQRHGPVANPRKAGEAVAAVKRADALYEKQQYGPAARLYQDAVETGLKTPPVLAAKEKLAKIEDMATKQLESARADLKDKAYPEAAAKLLELDRTFGSLKAGQEAREEIAKLRELPEGKTALEAAEKPAEATATPAQAKEPAGPPLDDFTDDDLAALDEMAQPQAARTVSRGTDAAEDECRRLFSLAQSWIDNNQPKRAVPLLEKIIEKHPTSRYARDAKALLEKLP